MSLDSRVVKHNTSNMLALALYGGAAYLTYSQFKERETVIRLTVRTALSKLSESTLEDIISLFIKAHHRDLRRKFSATTSILGSKGISAIHMERKPSSEKGVIELQLVVRHYGSLEYDIKGFEARFGGCIITSSVVRKGTPV